jgi:hypothetical protein
MLKVVAGLLFVCISYAGFSQVDTVRTLQLIKERGGYQKLTERFKNSDTTLTIEDFQLIYYGYQTSAAYYSKENEFKENLIKPLNKSGQYKQAIELADSILFANPVSIVAHFEKAFACAQLGLTAMENFHQKRYMVLCNVIKLSGNGSALLRYNANSVNDALEFLAFKGLKAVNDSKTETGLIQFDLAKNKQKLLCMYFYIPNKAYSPPLSESE